MPVSCRPRTLREWKVCGLGRRGMGCHSSSQSLSFNCSIAERASDLTYHALCRNRSSDQHIAQWNIRRRLLRPDLRSGNLSTVVGLVNEAHDTCDCRLSDVHYKGVRQGADGVPRCLEGSIGRFVWGIIQARSWTGMSSSCAEERRRSTLGLQIVEGDLGVVYKRSKCP